MKDTETHKIQESDNDVSDNSPLKQKEAVITSERLQNQFVQRGRIDIHLHEAAAEHLKQGAQALNDRDYKKAIQEFLQVLQHNNSSAEAHFHLGLAYFMLEDYEKAIDAYKNAIICEPSELTVYTNLAETYRLLKRYDDAIRVYQAAIQNASDNPELHSELGKVYSLKGKRQEAVDAYKRAMILKLKDSLASDNQERDTSNDE
ncbi:tetratricopeptide repeat protein [Candidatus Poribacteria bacterium]|nr:tetratricopeptide repeat protein [Candidatus Poribacteria bacterium]MYI95138.1 tetratricopeptide repeat protein [Candidatus Poribacteria bacterium]